VAGTVTNASNTGPMVGVQVSIDGQSCYATTDSVGHYSIRNVLIGEYAVRAAYPHFNDAVVPQVIVVLDSTTTVNFSMTHPAISLSVDSIHVTVPTQPSQTDFNVVNGGNGPLDYQISVAYAPGGSQLDDAWDLLSSINVSQATGDYLILGCEFAQDHWWITGGGGPNGAKLIYKFTRDGQYDGSIPQPATSGFGWFDMAYDGTNLYGSDSQNLTGINLVTGQLAVSIPSPLNPTRAIAYDPATDHFWVADYASDIYAIDRQGVIVDSISNQGANQLAITGLAWNPSDPDGFKLYIFSQNGSDPYTRVSRVRPASHLVQTVVNIPANQGDRSGGCTITIGWNSTLLVFGGIFQNQSGDRFGVYQMAFNTTWISVAPSQGTVSGGTLGAVHISFITTDLRPDFTYRVNLTIHSNVLDTSLVLPVALTVLPTSAEPEHVAGLPTEYALYQNYPNPFNPTTMIRYDLKAAGQAKLTVYNLMGQEVATLVNAVQPAGTYRVPFDASRLGSGVYFYRLESGEFVKVAKMVVMK
jgi:hypothetical protein